jgi:xanthine/uracil permease
MKTPFDLKYGVHDTPPLLTTLGLGLQYVLLMTSGLVFPVILIVNACSLSLAQAEYLFFATILVSAITSAIQIRRYKNIGSGYLMILGPSGVFIGCSISAVQMGGLPLMATMTFLSAPIEWLMAESLRHIRKLLTPALAGTVIMLIPILILPLVMPMWSISNRNDPAVVPAFICGFIPFLIILLANLQQQSLIKMWSPLIAILAGLTAASFMDLAHWTSLRGASWVSLPPNEWPGIETHLSWQHIPLFITFILATISSGIETFGDTIALQKVSEGRLDHIDYERIQGGLTVDTVGSMLSGTLGTFANTTYSSVMPVIQLTRVASRAVGYAACLIFAVLAFSPKFIHFFLAIPDPVMGGLTVSLMLILFSEGFKIAVSEGVNTESGLIIGSGLVFGLIAAFDQFFPALFPESFAPFSSNAIAVGGMVALALNIYFVYRPRNNSALKIQTDTKHLNALHAHITKMEEPLSLTKKEIFTLQLTAEEVYLQFKGDFDPNDYIHYHWTPENDIIHVEIMHTASSDYLTIPKKSFHKPALDTETLSELGLRILAKTAENIRHSKISGYNYLEYDIIRHSEPEK